MNIVTTAPTYVMYFLNTCEGNRLENCRINGYVTTSTSTSYSLIYNSTTSTHDANNEFRNNEFKDGSYGVYWNGYSSSPYEVGLVDRKSDV